MAPRLLVLDTAVFKTLSTLSVRREGAAGRLPDQHSDQEGTKMGDSATLWIRPSHNDSSAALNSRSDSDQTHTEPQRLEAGCPRRLAAATRALRKKIFHREFVLHTLNSRLYNSVQKV